MAATVKRRTTKSEITRQKLLEAARIISLEEGVSAVTVKRVCEKSGVSVGSFYNCFDGINSLISATDTDADMEFTIQSADQLQGSNELEKLLDFAHHYASLNVHTGVRTLSELMTPGLGNAQFLRNKPMNAIVETVFERGQNQGQITRNYTPEQMREMFFVTMRGCSYDWCMHEGNYDLEEKMLRHVKLLLYVFTRID